MFLLIKGHQNGVSRQSSLKYFKFGLNTFPHNARMKIRTDFLTRLTINQSSIMSQILDFIFFHGYDFYFRWKSLRSTKLIGIRERLIYYTQWRNTVYTAVLWKVVPQRINVRDTVERYWVMVLNCCLIEAKGFQRERRRQHKYMYSCFPLLETAWTLTALDNTDRYYRVHFCPLRDKHCQNSRI